MWSRSVLILGGLGDIAQSMSDVISNRLPETKVHLADARQAHAADPAILLLPPAEKESYPEELRALIERFNPDVIIPTNEGEIHRLAASDIHPLVASRALLESRENILHFGDKLLTYEWGIRNGIPAVPTRVASLASEVGFPLIIKPRSGSGGKGQTILQNSAQLEGLPQFLSDSYVVQPYQATAQEFTCIAARNGSSVHTLVLERTLRHGRSNWIRVADDATVLDVAYRTTALLAPKNSINFQFLLSNDELGLIDVNPRFSSTVAMRDALGFSDLVWTLNRAFNQGAMTYERPRPGAVVEWADDEGRALLVSHT